MRSFWKIFVTGLNLLGLFCLVWFAWPYVTHDTRILNPEAMLAAERWDEAGFALTLGVIPLLTANALAFATIGKEIFTGKKRLLFFVPSLICILIVAHYWSDALTSRESVSAAPAAEVVLKEEGEKEWKLVRVYEDGGMMDLGVTQPDASAVYYEFDAWNFSLHSGGEKAYNSLVRDEVKDQDGKEAKAPEEVKACAAAAAKENEHVIWRMRVYETGNEYFAAVWLNVNWQDPCLFYRYDKEEKTVKLLTRWDGVEIRSVSSPNP